MNSAVLALVNAHKNSSKTWLLCKSRLQLAFEICPAIVKYRFCSHFVYSFNYPGLEPYCISTSDLLCWNLDNVPLYRSILRLHRLHLHRPVHHTDVPVDGLDGLAGTAGILLAPLAHLNPLSEQPQEFRRQFVNGSYRFAFSMNVSTFAADAFSFSSRASFSGIASSRIFCSAL